VNAIVPETFVFLLVPDFSLISLASALEPLRSANRLGGDEFYRWRLVSLSGGFVSASSGIALETEVAKEAITGAEAVFVCGGLRLDLEDERGHLALLRGAARAGLVVGALSTGAVLLARAGLLEGHRCTIHWESRPGFVEEFPELTCTNHLFEVDGKRVTASGGTAPLDLMLQLIGERHGAGLARAVADQFHHDRIRQAGEVQQESLERPLGQLPKVLDGAVSRMRETIEAPIALSEIAAAQKVSVRQLERMFGEHLGKTPARFYLEMRIERGRELLIYSDQPILSVAMACGFSSASHFSAWYRRIIGTTPSVSRRMSRKVS
jgi:AraC family transcriptional regulator, glycine betaine-responsive activator